MNDKSLKKTLTTAWWLPHVRENFSTVHSTVVVLLLTTGSCVVTSGVGQWPSSITSSSFNRTYRTGYCSKSCLSERWFCSWTRKPPMSRFSCLKNRKMGKLDLYTSICCFVSKPLQKDLAFLHFMNIGFVANLEMFTNSSENFSIKKLNLIVTTIWTKWFSGRILSL